MSDVLKFIGVCKMLTVPCEEKVTAVIRRECQMERITKGMAGHDVVGDVGLNHRINGRCGGQEGEGVIKASALSLEG